MLPESTQWSVVSTPVEEPGDESGTEVASNVGSWGAIWNCPYSPSSNENSPSEDEDNWGNWRAADAPQSGAPGLGAPTTPPKDGKAPQPAKSQEMPPPKWLPTSKAVLVKTRPRPAPIKQMPQVKGGAPPKIQALWPDIAPEPNISASGAARILAMTPYCQGPPIKAMPPSPFPKPAEESETSRSAGSQNFLFGVIE